MVFNNDHQTNSQFLQFSGKVAIITGAARGLGREYALLLASRGAAVVVNDLGGNRDGTGQSSSAADNVVQEIITNGGRAVADYHSVEQGEEIVQTALKNFGRIDIVINNAGILRDKSMMKITEEDWDLVHRVHLRGAFFVTKAAWPHFRAQNYGRIIMTSSSAAIYGNFGQANYSSAKLGLLSLAKTLAVEGAKYDIRCNTIIPVAASRLTEDLLPEDIFNLFQPRYVAPLVAYLCHADCPANGEVFEAAGGYFGRYRWQRSAGRVFTNTDQVTIENIRDCWNEIIDMSRYSSPNSTHEHALKLINQLKGEDSGYDNVDANSTNHQHHDNRHQHNGNQNDDDNNDNNDNSEEEAIIHRYTAQDLILYALSVGVTTLDQDNLNYLYEADENFTALPTFGTTIALNAVYDSGLFQEAINRYGLVDNLIRTLHGEQYMKLCQPLDVGFANDNGEQVRKLVSKPKIVDVLDKGSGALIIIEVHTFDQTTGQLIFYNQLGLFMIGSGQFGGHRHITDSQHRSRIVQCEDVPSRPPDAIIRQRTSTEQAATFRLCGDRNPLHIDPNFSTIGGFDQPILHGLCMLGFAVRHVLRQYATDLQVVNNGGHHNATTATVFDAVKARFVGTIIPGQTIETRIWRGATAPTTSADDRHHHPLTRIHFECYVYETGNKIISSAFVDLKLPPPSPSLSPSPLGVNSNINNHNHNQNNNVNNHISATFQSSSSSNNNTESPLYTTIGSSSMSSSIEQKFIDTGTVKCEIDKIFGGTLVKKIRKNGQIVSNINTIYQFNITKNGQQCAKWTLDLKNLPGDIYRGELKNGAKPDCILTVDDQLIVDLFNGKQDGVQAFMAGQLKVTGNVMAAQKLQQLWSNRSNSSGDDDNDDDSTNVTTTTTTTTTNDEVIDEEDKKILDSVPITGLKSDLVFTLLSNRMHEEPDIIRRLRASYQFNITLNGKYVTTWTAENKTDPNGCVYNDAYRNGKPDCLTTVEDDDFVKLMFGKLNPQRAFMLGKLKVKGNIMLLQRLNSIWLELLKSGKAPEFPYIVELMYQTDLIPGLRSEVMVIELIQRLIRLPYLCTEVASLVGFEILKQGQVVAQYTLDFTKNKQTGVFTRGLPSGEQYCVLSMSDDDFTRLTRHRFTLEQGIEAKKIQVRGDRSIPPKISIIFKTPTSRIKL